MDILTQILFLNKNADVNIAEILIDKTKAEIALFCKTNYIPAMDNVCCDIVLYKLNQLGNEGILAQSYNGVSESYINDYPFYIKQQLNSFRKRVFFK